MTNITLDSLPAKTGTISDSGIIHYRESGVDKKVSISDLLIKISSQYQPFINTFLGTIDKAAARAALDITRRTAVNNTDYTILVTDKVVAQIGTMSATRTFTLPAASTYPAGEELIIIDESGSVTSSNKISVVRSSTDTIDGSTSKNIDYAYGCLKLVCNGSNSWKVENVNPATNTIQGISYLPQKITIANNTSDPNNDIDFSGGNFVFSDFSGQAYVPAMTKRLDANWTAGTNQGGLDTGTKQANTPYYGYAIYNPTTNVADYIFSASKTSPTLPSGFTKKEYKGACHTDGSANIRQGTWTYGKSQYSFIYSVNISDLAITNPGTSAGLYPMSVPAGPNVFSLAIYAHVQISPGSSLFGLFSSPYQTDSVPSISNYTNFVASGDSISLYNGLIAVNDSRQIRARVSASDGNTSLRITTIGWIEYL